MRLKIKKHVFVPSRKEPKEEEQHKEKEPVEVFVVTDTDAKIKNESFSVVSEKENLLEETVASVQKKVVNPYVRKIQTASSLNTLSLSPPLCNSSALCYNSALFEKKNEKDDPTSFSSFSFDGNNPNENKKEKEKEKEKKKSSIDFERLVNENLTETDHFDMEGLLEEYISESGFLEKIVGDLTDQISFLKEQQQHLKNKNKNSLLSVVPETVMECFERNVPTLFSFSIQANPIEKDSVSMFLAPPPQTLLDDFFECFPSFFDSQLFDGQNSHANTKNNKNKNILMTPTAQSSNNPIKVFFNMEKTNCIYQSIVYGSIKNKKENNNNEKEYDIFYSDVDYFRWLTETWGQLFSSSFSSFSFDKEEEEKKDKKEKKEKEKEFCKRCFIKSLPEWVSSSFSSSSSSFSLLFSDLEFSYQEVLHLIKRYCPSLVEHVFWDIEGPFFSRYEPEMREVAFSIQSTMVDCLENKKSKNAWILSPEARNVAAEKIKAIKIYMGKRPGLEEHVSFLLDAVQKFTVSPKNIFGGGQKGKSVKNKRYDADVVLYMCSNFFGAQHMFFLKRELQKTKAPWQIPTFYRSACYDMMTNSIYVPLGMMAVIENAKKHFHSPPPSLSFSLFREREQTIKKKNIAMYATFGSILGHEMFHAIDERGSFYDKHGKPFGLYVDRRFSKFMCSHKSFYGPLDRDAFWSKLKQPAQDLYGNFRFQFSESSKNPSLVVDGVRTCDENLADIAGLQCAYTCLFGHQKEKEHHLKEKEEKEEKEKEEKTVFFSAWARCWARPAKSYNELKHQIDHHHHAPEPFRVNGSLSTIPDFKKMFFGDDDEQQDKALLQIFF